MTDNKPIVVIEHKKRTIILPIKIAMYIGASYLTYVVYTQLGILDVLETTIEKDIKQALEEFGIGIEEKNKPDTSNLKQPTEQELLDFFSPNMIDKSNLKQPTYQELLDLMSK